MKLSNYPALKAEIMAELDDCVCTRHPPDWNIEIKAHNIIAIMEGYLFIRDQSQTRRSPGGGH